MSDLLIPALAQMTRAVAQALWAEGSDLEQNWEGFDTGNAASRGFYAQAERLEELAKEIDAMATP